MKNIETISLGISTMLSVDMFLLIITKQFDFPSKAEPNVLESQLRLVQIFVENDIYLIFSVMVAQDWKLAFKVYMKMSLETLTEVILSKL
jgi:hypothetical protein